MQRYLKIFLVVLTITWLAGATLAHATHGFIMDKMGYTSFDYPGAYATYARGINNIGQIVGSFIELGSGGHGFLKTDSAFSAIEFPATSATFAHDINDAGQIVGYYVDSASNLHGFLMIGGINTSISYPGNTDTINYGINNAGQIVGYSWHNIDPHPHAFIWNTDNSFTSINYPGALATIAFGINDAGQVVGNYYDTHAIPHGFLFSSGVYTSIDFPAAAFTARDINNSGVIVGYTNQWGFIKTNEDYSFVNFSGAAQTFPCGINDSGQIVGYYDMPSVAVPPSAILMSSGLLALIGWRRLKKR